MLPKTQETFGMLRINPSLASVYGLRYDVAGICRLAVMTHDV